MNNKLLRKLTLSAVTLGVAAISATTSTFAWFTTNGTVTANSISGTVKASDALVLIKSPTAWVEKSVTESETTTTTIEPKYTTTVNQTDASGNAITTDSNGSESTLSTESTHNFATSTTLVNEGGSTTTDLAPVAINSIDVTGSFVERNANTHEYTAAASNTHYLHYQVVLAISSLDSTKTYDVKMTLPSLNINTNSQYLLADSVASTHTSYANYKTGQTISVGVKDVLSVGIKNTIVSSEEDAQKYGLSNGVSLTTSGNDQQYSADASGWYHAIAEDTSGADAVTYYNNVYGLTGQGAIARPKHVKANPTDSDPGKDDSGNFKATEEYSTYYKSDALYKVTNKKDENDSSKTTDEIESITCTDKVIYKLANTTSAVVVTDLYFFIDGWDYQCFNAVSGMSLFATGSNKISFTVAQAAQAEATE